MVDERLRFQVATGLMSLYTLNGWGSERALELARNFSDSAVHGSIEDTDIRSQLIKQYSLCVC